MHLVHLQCSPQSPSPQRLQERGDMESEEYRSRVIEELRRIRISLYVLAKCQIPGNASLGEILNGILEGQFQPHEEPARPYEG